MAIGKASLFGAGLDIIMSRQLKTKIKPLFDRLEYAKQLVDSQDSRFGVKDMRTITTVILASMAAPPQAAGSQKEKEEQCDLLY